MCRTYVDGGRRFLHLIDAADHVQDVLHDSASHAYHNYVCQRSGPFTIETHRIHNIPSVLYIHATDKASDKKLHTIPLAQTLHETESNAPNIRARR